MNKYKVSAISISLGVVFTALIYNITFSTYIYRYLAIAFFYCILYAFIYSKIKQALFVFILVLSVPILIDSSVLITFPAIIPLRFPYSTTFAILGAIAGYLYSAKKWLNLTLFTFLLITYSYIGHKYIIPSILYKILQRSKKIEIPATFLHANFYTVALKQIKLMDTLNDRCNLLECFFVGCPPCEQKVPLLKKIVSLHPAKDFHIIMICDGTITSWESFLNYSNNSTISNATYLYDKDSVLHKYGIKGFPTEILTSKTKVFFVESGYAKESENIYLLKEMKKINTVIYETTKK